MSAWLREQRFVIGAFVVALLVYGAVAGSRLGRRSSDPHFVYQAAAWLDGRLDIPQWPRGADDPARVEEVELQDGRVVRGRQVATRGVFRIAGGEDVPLAQVARVRRTIFYNSFPWFPSVLMLPQVAVSGTAANDVAFTVLAAALAPALLLLLLRRLRQLGLSTRDEREDLWYAALLGFGTVFFFSSVQGRVWFTAHVVGVDLALAYVLFAVGARRPLAAGAMLACAFVTRTPMLFMAPLFLLEAWRTRAPGDNRALARKLALFAAPVIAVGLVAAWMNLARFGEPGEFGHSYLAVRQQAQIERYGLFNLHYLGRNLAVAFTLLPDISLSRAPYVSISGHGLAMWVTTPALLYLLWPRERGPLHRALWLTVACVALPALLYQNSGWVQFGYRFSLDYMALLVVLLAIGGRRQTRLFKALVVLGIAVNLFGAYTFNRVHKHYRTDASTYNVVVPH